MSKTTVCVRACVRACVRVCVNTYIYMHARQHNVCVRARVCIYTGRSQRNYPVTIRNQGSLFEVDYTFLGYVSLELLIRYLSSDIHFVYQLHKVVTLLNMNNHYHPK